MRKLLYIIPLMLIWSACGTTTTSGKESETLNEAQAATEAMPDSSAKQAKTDTVKKAAPSYPRYLFTDMEAAGILGEAIHLKDSSYVMSISTKAYKCAFVSNTPDSKTGAVADISFAIEDYNQPGAAHDAYAALKTKNNKKALRELKGVGDEGYMIIDGNKQWVVSIRKGKRMFKIEVDKLPMSASIVQFTSVAKKITDAI